MYCEKEDLEAAVRDGAVDDWTGLDDQKVFSAIGNASSEIDGYLISGGYSVPLSPVPTHVKGHAVSISLYNLIVGRGITDDPADQEIAEKKKAAIRFLEGVATGKFKIPIGGEGSGEQSRPVGKFRIKSDPKMNMEGYL